MCHITQNLAAVFQDLLMNRDDYLRALRALFREIVKALRYDVDFLAFCRGLMAEKTERQFTELDKQVKVSTLNFFHILIVGSKSGR